MHTYHNKPILSVKNLSKAYGENPVLSQVALELNKGEVVCLLGESGVGKTTLFHLMAGLSKPDSGCILLNDGDITGQTGRLGYMLQKDLLLPYKTVLDNVCLPFTLANEKKEAAYAKALPLFPLFGLSGYEKCYPAQLSGGMRQRAALLRTYFLNKPVLLLDEPFSALDTATKESLHHWFLQVAHAMGLSVLCITHDIDEAIFLSDRIYILKGKPGRIVHEMAINVQAPDSGEKWADKSGFKLSEAFLDYKRKLTALLSSSAM